MIMAFSTKQAWTAAAQVVKLEAKCKRSQESSYPHAFTVWGLQDYVTISVPLWPGLTSTSTRQPLMPLTPESNHSTFPMSTLSHDFGDSARSGLSQYRKNFPCLQAPSQNSVDACEHESGRSRKIKTRQPFLCWRRGGRKRGAGKAKPGHENQRNNEMNANITNKLLTAVATIAVLTVAATAVRAGDFGSGRQGERLGRETRQKVDQTTSAAKNCAQSFGQGLKTGEGKPGTCQGAGAETRKAANEAAGFARGFLGKR